METTASDRPSKVAKTSEAKDAHIAASIVNESHGTSFAQLVGAHVAKSAAKATSLAPPSVPLPAAAEQNRDAPSDSNIILELKDLKVRSTPPVESVNNDQKQKLVCGNAINSTRMRSEVIVVCPLHPNVGIPAALNASYDKLKQPGVTGLIVSEFDNCIAATTLEDKTKN